ncbi:MAG: hypothetical protein A4E30_00042 [Methanomassiliicoccales archaeon PtaB.Bin215]|nr:MAG: hypothetical protein A4E30_00042 [Methanomassiliicoccales archaeon PtaB.Bin215]
MCRSDVPMKRSTMSTPASTEASMSSLVILERTRMSASRFSSQIAFTDAFSLSETAGKPASIWCTCISSSLRAMATFWSKLNVTPGVCSPSRRVES